MAAAAAPAVVAAANRLEMVRRPAADGAAWNPANWAITVSWRPCRR